MNRLQTVTVAVMALMLFQVGCDEAWTPEMAREEAFRDVQSQIDLSDYPSRDPDFEENQEALRDGRMFVDDRYITPEEEADFAYVVSKLGKNRLQLSTMFYGSDGRLLFVRFFSGQEYPRAGYYYCAEPECVESDKRYLRGQLMGVDLDVSPNERFNFGPEGKLRGHLTE